jgi:hypothetical protein
MEPSAFGENRRLAASQFPDAIGAHITWQAGDLKRTRLKIGGGSYFSSHDPREVLRIGNRTRIDKLEIHWRNQAVGSILSRTSPSTVTSPSSKAPESSSLLPLP